MGVFTISALAAPEWPSDVSIQADAGIVMDSDTGTVLYGKNMDQPYYSIPADRTIQSLCAACFLALSSKAMRSHRQADHPLLNLCSW